jgi:exoribonuclease-2
MIVGADSLVVYKKRPGRVLRAGEKLVVEIEGGKTVNVRPKDVVLLHQGPLKDLDELQPQSGEVELAWEILAESTASGQERHTLPELAELIYGEFNPATAWAAWEWLEDGLYFHGTTINLAAYSSEEVARKRELRQSRETEKSAWDDFVTRLKLGRIEPEVDSPYLGEVEDLALGRRKTNRVLRELNRAARPEVAHALLLELGFWDHNTNPYPIRFGLEIVPPVAALPELSDETRVDLTHLAAFAIDDRDNQDPDDAISLEDIRYEDGRFEGGRIWVHIADVGALVAPDSEADLEARARGTTLYLPEVQVPMLPVKAVEILGLGLNETSPALSFGIDLNELGEISNVEIVASWVQVERLAYEHVDERIEEAPFDDLYRVTQVYQERRRANGALFIDLPEVMVSVQDGSVNIRPVQLLDSRAIVREAMILAGEAVAKFALEHQIPFPFATQELPDQIDIPESAEPTSSTAVDLAAQYAIRRVLKRSKVTGLPSIHAGVGLGAYSRVTSPLRRYLDLVAHQQIRAYLGERPLLGEQEMLKRVGSSEAITSSANKVMSLSRRHWTLVYLMQNPKWCGQGVLVQKRGLRGRVLIPELAYETFIHLRRDLPLNSHLELRIKKVNLPELEGYFEYKLVE